MGKDQQRGLQYALKEVMAIGSKKNIAERFKIALEVSRSFGDTGLWWYII